MSEEGWLIELEASQAFRKRCLWKISEGEELRGLTLSRHYSITNSQEPLPIIKPYLALNKGPDGF